MDHSLPPPPPRIPPNFTPSRVVSDRVPMRRHGYGAVGRKIPLLTNHFKVNVKNFDGHFYHYSVAIFYEDGHPVDGKGFGRKVLDCVRVTYAAEFSANEFAYDGEKSLFTAAPLPGNKLDFTVVLEDEKKSRRSNGDDDDDGSDPRKRLKRPSRSKTFRVKISFAAEIPMQAIRGALLGQESHSSLEGLRVLDIILRQHAARQGCLLVRQSFFHNHPQNFDNINGGVLACRGFHSSFRTTKSGLSLNIDVSTTTIVQPGPVLNFLFANQNVRDRYSIDWVKAKRTLKNLRVAVRTTNREFKITGLSEKACREQMFTLKQRTNGGDQTEEVTVYDYFVNHRKINLRYPELPCINVGKPNRPTYFPIELCELVSLQHYTKALSTQQRSNMVGLSRQNPQQRMQALSDALRVNNYEADPMLRSCGVSISSNFTQVEGRVLPAPKLKSAEGDVYVNKGRWNFNNKKFVEPCMIQDWFVVSFSTRCDIHRLITDLKKVGEAKGIAVQKPLGVFEENRQYERAPPMVRVEKMFEQMMAMHKNKPRFVLCLLPEPKNSAIYGPWKRRCLCDVGIVTQCMYSNPKRPPNDQYLTNLLLKINAKLGGLSSVLSGEIRRPLLPMVTKVPTLILGMDVSHGSPGQSDTPSIAAVVSSREWPSICRYRASVRTQSPKLEMIDSLFKPVTHPKVRDDGIFNELLFDFYVSSGSRRPEHIIIFRDGVSESQFNQVLNIELNQIKEACKYRDEKWSPKFVVLVAQKNHHTRFFDQKPNSNSADNMMPGTIVDDSNVCHPSNFDFYLCAHTGIGTMRPTHYHVLLDEAGFSPDELQELVHSLSYVYQRSTTAVSVVAPICYAHLAASQMGQFIKFDDVGSETSSSHNGAGPAVPVPPMPTLKDNVRNTMFFC